MADADDILSARLIVPDHVVRREFSEQTIALNLATGQYYSLNVTGAVMMDKVADGECPADAVPSLTATFGRSADLIRKSLASLCHELLACGLLEVVEDGDG